MWWCTPINLTARGVVRPLPGRGIARAFPGAKSETVDLVPPRVPASRLTSRSDEYILTQMRQRTLLPEFREGQLIGVLSLVAVLSACSSGCADSPPRGASIDPKLTASVILVPGFINPLAWFQARFPPNLVPAWYQPRFRDGVEGQIRLKGASALKWSDGKTTILELLFPSENPSLGSLPCSVLVRKGFQGSVFGVHVGDDSSKIDQLKGLGRLQPRQGGGYLDFDFLGTSGWSLTWLNDASGTIELMVLWNSRFSAEDISEGVQRLVAKDSSAPEQITTTSEDSKPEIAQQLCVAAASGDQSSVEKLLNEGASIGMPCDSGHLSSPVEFASVLGRSAIVKVFNRKAAQQGTPVPPRSALEAALRGGDHEVIRLLLEAGVPVEFKDFGRVGGDCGLLKLLWSHAKDRSVAYMGLAFGKNCSDPIFRRRPPA